MQAHEIMTPDVITITPHASLQDAARKLSDYNISGMPVVDGDKQVIGMVTEADIITKRGSTVEEIMTRRLVSVQEDTSVDEIAQLLTSRRIKRVPVMAGNLLLGIVSRADIVRMMAGRWVCEVCGSIHLGKLPAACEACGVDAHHLSRHFDMRPEISTR